MPVIERRRIEGCIDLHVHTTASDGTLRPAEVVRLAKKLGLQAISITDHDTLDGLDEAIEAGDAVGVEIIPGIELSAAYRDGTIHILGYYVDRSDPEFVKEIDHLQRVRVERNEQMLNKLIEFGINITFEDLRKESKEGLIGRPHFARLLLKKGVVGTMDEAFEKFLRKGAPTYVSKVRLSSEDAIGMILRNGAIPVLAHPFVLKKDCGIPLQEIIAELVGYGLQGLEDFYSSHTSEEEAEYLELAQSKGLLATGGSDFHGSVKSEYALGFGSGNLCLSLSLLDKLKTAMRKKESKDI